MDDIEAGLGAVGRGRRAGMRRLVRAAGGLVLLVALGACASTKVTSTQAYTGPTLPRPDRILVDDFGATPGEVPPNSGLALHAAGNVSQTPEEIAMGRKLGAEVARQLVLDLQNMGLPAVQAAGQPPPQPNDIVIKGNFYSVDEGNAAERILIGFNAGADNLGAAVEAYQMTPEGLRRLGGGETDATGNETPGVVAPAVVFAATHNPIGLIVVGAIKLHGQEFGLEHGRRRRQAHRRRDRSTLQGGGREARLDLGAGAGTQGPCPLVYGIGRSSRA